MESLYPPFVAFLGGPLLGSGLVLVLDGIGGVLEGCGMDGLVFRNMSTVVLLLLLPLLTLTLSITSFFLPTLLPYTLPPQYTTPLTLAALSLSTFFTPILILLTRSILPSTAPATITPHKPHFMTWRNRDPKVAVGQKMEQNFLGSSILLPSSSKFRLPTSTISVLVTSSISCPISIAQAPALDEIIGEFRKDVEGFVVYSSEAHPCGCQGVKMTPAYTLEVRKERCAEFQAETGVKNVAFVVDDDAATLHTTLGLMPNSVTVLDKDLTVVFHSKWIKPQELRKAILQALDKPTTPPLAFDAAIHSPLDPPLHFPTVMKTLYRFSGVVGVVELFLALSQEKVSSLFNV